MENQQSLKSRTIRAVIWSGIGKMSTTGVSFITNIILARLLLPKDFGAVAMLQIFISISDVLISCGFGAALIQMKNPTHIDFSSVFYWNLIASVFLFIILFLASPLISDFYEMPILTDVMRVQSIVLIISAFSIVQSCQLQKKLDFKSITKRNIGASFAGMIVSIPMALLGFGIWSLVASSISSSIVGTVLLWKLSKWRPSLEFSKKSLNELFGFGGLMALTSLVDTFYSEIQGMIIGKYYSPVTLGLYSQANKLQQMPVKTLSTITNNVTFPVFSEIQDNKERLYGGVRCNYQVLAFLNVILCVMMIVVAPSLIYILYGSNWLNAIPYFRILCIGGLIYSLNSLNTSIMKALGRSDVFFWTQLLKRIVGLALIVIGAFYGVEGLLWAVVLSTYLNFIVNSVVSGKLMGYGLIKQLYDIIPCIVAAFFAAGTALLSARIVFAHPIFILAIQTLILIVVYTFLLYLFRYQGLNLLIEVVRKKRA